MQITQSLPQFETDAALFIVTGKQTAEFYLAHAGEIVELDAFTAEVLEPDERPGHFESQVDGKTLQSGSAFDPTRKHHDAKHAFFKEFPKHLERVIANRDITQVFVFSPDYMITELEGALPGALREKIAMSVQGNFTKHHPFKLLERVQQSGQHTSAQRAPANKLEVKKILRRFFRK